MKYIVREEGKDGGADFYDPQEAIDAAVAWRLATDKRCEIFILLDRSPFNGAQSIAHTLEADIRYASMVELAERIGIL